MNIQLTKDFISEECCSCGVIFYISKKLQDNFKKNKQSFYCPNGHSQSYNKSTVDILKEKLSAKENELSIKEDEFYGLESENLKLKKQLKKQNKKKSIKKKKS